MPSKQNFWMGNFRVGPRPLYQRSSRKVKNKQKYIMYIFRAPKDPGTGPLVTSYLCYFLFPAFREVSIMEMSLNPNASLLFWRGMPPLSRNCLPVISFVRRLTPMSIPIPFLIWSNKYQFVPFYCCAHVPAPKTTLIRVQRFSPIFLVK